MDSGVESEQKVSSSCSLKSMRGMTSNHKQKNGQYFEVSDIDLLLIQTRFTLYCFLNSLLDKYIFHARLNDKGRIPRRRHGSEIVYQKTFSDLK